MSFFSRIMSRSRSRHKKEQLESQVRAVAQQIEEAVKDNEQEQQEQMIEQMRVLEGKIETWEKKLENVNVEKRELMTQLLPYKQKSTALPPALMRKLAKCNKLIKLTESQLSALEEKLTDMKQQFDNKEIIEALDEANKVVDLTAPSSGKVQEVINKVEDQMEDLNEVNNAFLFNSTASFEVDSEDLELQLAEFEAENGTGNELAELDVDQTKGLPLPKKVQSVVDRPEEETDIELQRQLQGLQM